MKRRELELTNDERAWLEHFTGAGSAHHQAFKRAQILLAADEPNCMGDAEIAKTLGVSKATVYNVRSRYLAPGVEATVHRKARKDKGVPEKVDGRVEAHIVALACSATPNEEPVWTLTMLADKLVALELVDSMSWPERTLPGLPASREKVRQVLKKTSSSRS